VRRGRLAMISHPLRQRRCPCANSD